MDGTLFAVNRSVEQIRREDDNHKVIFYLGGPRVYKNS